MAPKMGPTIFSLLLVYLTLKLGIFSTSVAWTPWLSCTRDHCWSCCSSRTTARRFNLRTRWCTSVWGSDLLLIFPIQESIIASRMVDTPACGWRLLLCYRVYHLLQCQTGNDSSIYNPEKYQSGMPLPERIFLLPCLLCQMYIQTIIVPLHVIATWTQFHHRSSKYLLLKEPWLGLKCITVTRKRGERRTLLHSTPPCPRFISSRKSRPIRHICIILCENGRFR